MESGAHSEMYSLFMPVLKGKAAPIAKAPIAKSSKEFENFEIIIKVAAATEKAVRMYTAIGFRPHESIFGSTKITAQIEPINFRFPISDKQV